MNVFTYKVEKDNTGFGWNGKTPAYEVIKDVCIIPTDCRKKARRFVKKWALKNGFISAYNRLVNPLDLSISIRTNF
jgi:hypothetical protein